MPEPQPGAERPAAGNTPAPPPSVTEARDQAVPRQPGSSAVPDEQTVENSARHPSGEPATEENPAGPDRTAVEATPDRTTLDPAPPDRTAVEAAAPSSQRPDATRIDRAGPDPTKLDRMAEQVPDAPPAPRWSGSASVPPPAPKKRRWGHSAEPTPPPVPPPVPPESQMPVDPWAGADTGSWDLNAGYEPLPPTRMYPTPQDAPAWTPPEPPAPAWTPPPAGHQPPPVTPQPPPAAPVSGQPVPPPYAHPTPPPPVARPASPAAFPPPVARPVSPAAFPPPVSTPPAQPAFPPPPPARPVPAQPAAARPVSPPPARPVSPPVAPARQRRNPAPAPVTPPPNWQAPQGYAPPPRRKKRRWPTRMLILTLLSIACCCGCPAWFGKPIWDQYPASASLPHQVADLRLQTDARSERTVTELRTEVENEHPLAEGAFAGVYRTPQGKTVTIFGSTGLRFTPETHAEQELARLTPKYKLGNPQTVETDERGQHQRCAVGRADNADVVVCTWADYGSLASGVFTRLSLADSAALLGSLREQIVTRQ